MGRKKDLKKDLDEDLMDIREPEEGKKETLVDIICRNIRRDIIVGELIPGEKLMAKDLAEKYGTSETPVKLALNRMISEEVVENYPRQGMVIKPMTLSDAEEIFDLVKGDSPEIGLATVYRTIQLFMELHLIDRINLDDGFVRYEIGDMGTKKNSHHHHHLICLSCGRVMSVEDDLLEELEAEIARTTGFKVTDHEVKLYGYCKECGGNLIEKNKTSE